LFEVLHSSSHCSAVSYKEVSKASAFVLEKLENVLESCGKVLELRSQKLVYKCGEFLPGGVSVRCAVDSGTLEDTELIDGLVFNQKTAGAGGPKKVEKAKIGLIQFCISPPKTDVCLLVCVFMSAVQLYTLLAAFFFCWSDPVGPDLAGLFACGR